MEDRQFDKKNREMILYLGSFFLPGGVQVVHAKVCGDLRHVGVVEKGLKVDQIIKVWK